MVRAFQPWPGAWFFLNIKNKQRKLTITSASVEKIEYGFSSPPGSLLQLEKNRWAIVSGKDILVIHKLIPDGKREMAAEDFFRGNSPEIGSTA